jgi:cell division protein FtsI/penicillin-binding protein 2
MASTSVNSQRRLWLLFAGSCLVFALLGQRLFHLQIVRGQYYDAVAVNQRKRAAELFPHRGTIYVAEDREKELFPIAVNTRKWIAYAVPRDIDNPSFVAEQLAPGLLAFRQRQRARVQDILRTTGQAAADEEPPPPEGVPEDDIAVLREELIQKFNQKTDPYEPFLKLYEVADDELKKYLEDRKLPGIVLEEKEVRYYPESTLAAHVLGYVGWQDDEQVGRYGVEGFFEPKLAGSLGFLAARCVR